MSKKRTWSGEHHWVPKKEWTTPLHEELFDNVKTYLEHEEHVQVHQDEKEVGPIGSIFRCGRRRWKEKFR